MRITLISPVLPGWDPSDTNLLWACANSTRACSTTQHNSTSPPPPSAETHRHLSDADFICSGQFRLGATGTMTLGRVTARARYSNCIEPGYNEVGTAAPGTAGSRAYIEDRWLPPPHGPTLLDVSLTHPRAATHVTDAAAMQGSSRRNMMP